MKFRQTDTPTQAAARAGFIPARHPQINSSKASRADDSNPFAGDRGALTGPSMRARQRPSPGHSQDTG
jgi:hypothetical protein